MEFFRGGVSGMNHAPMRRQQPLVQQQFERPSACCALAGAHFQHLLRDMDVHRHVRVNAAKRERGAAQVIERNGAQAVKSSAGPLFSNASSEIAPISYFSSAWLTRRRSPKASRRSRN